AVGEAGASEVGLRPEAEARGPAVTVDVEDDALPLPHHPEDRPGQCVRRQVVLAAVGVADQHALTGTRVVRLDHALQEKDASAPTLGCRGTYRSVSLTGEFALIQRLARRWPA